MALPCAKEVANDWHDWRYGIAHSQFGAGGLTDLVLRRGWGLKAALIDAAIALVVVALAAYVVAAIEAARGVWGSRATLV